jgi:membrane complex biogenesis BtpA family protein
VKKLVLNSSIVGMIHVGALPGTPKYAGSFDKVVEKACEEAKIYDDLGLDAIAIENMHDVPYLKGQVGSEISSAMTVVAKEITKTVKIPCGIQILAGANKEALSVALCAGLSFIRAEGFVFAHVADEGIIESSAAELLRFRKSIGAEHIQVFTDIKKKHSSHSITEDVGIADTAKAAEFFLSDGVIVTGGSTGQKADIEDIKSTKSSVSIPVIVGSGVTLENVGDYLKISDALIVGSYFKKDGCWENDLDMDRISKFMDKVNSLR